MSVVPRELSSLSPRTQPNFFLCDDVKCTKASTKCTTKAMVEDDYEWAIRLQCTVCKSTWWICKHCTLRSKFVVYNSLKRHQYGKHANATQCITTPTTSARSTPRNTPRKTPPSTPTTTPNKKTTQNKRKQRDVDDNPFRNSEEIVEATDEPIYSRILVSDKQKVKNKQKEKNNIENNDDGDVKMKARTNNDMDVEIIDMTSSQNDNEAIDVSNGMDDDNKKEIIRSKRLLHFMKEQIGDNETQSGALRTTMIDHYMKDSSVHKVNNNTSNYYSYEIMSSGPKYLISKMWCKEESTMNDVFGRLSDEEVNCQMKIGNFARSLTRGQQQDFADIIDGIKNIYVDRKVVPVCKLATTNADVRRLYVDGINSVTKNLPIPDVKMLKKHSYVSLKDCIADMLLDNSRVLKSPQEYIERAKFHPNDLSMFGCERIREIADVAVERNHKEVDNTDSEIVVLFLKLWSDDFDPNNSIKSNRQSVWVQTVTIFAMTNDDYKLSYTYPIAASAKGEEHDDVYQILSKELETLRSGAMPTFFCRYTKSPVKVHADIYCILADQPERRSNLCLGAGNSRFHKRFGYLCDINQCLDVIRACDECEEEILTRTNDMLDNEFDGDVNQWQLDPCKKCSGWLMFDKHKLLLYTPDKNYPVSKLNKTGKLGPKQITKKHLESCLRDVRMALHSDFWNTLTCKAFLQSEGFNAKATDDIIDYTLNTKTYKEAEENKSEEPERWKVINSDYKKNPVKYQDWALPSSWYYMKDTSLYVDVPMHLVFLGVAKTVFIKIARWLKLKMQSKAFKALTSGIGSIQKQLKRYNLTWLKVLHYPQTSTDKFGGWVAENFLAFVRLTPWFYTLLHELKEVKDPPNLETPPTAWRKKENAFWLDLRGLNSTGNAKLLKDRVRMYLDMEDPPPILPKTTVDKEDVLSMLHSMHRMICMLMSPNTDEDDIGKMELAIRSFLIYYDKVDIGMGKKDKPSWASSYNFLCLLNLPDVIRKYGNLRNIWEGGIEGEGFLRKYKREMKTGLLPNWQEWTVRNCLQRGVFNKENIVLSKPWKEVLQSECRIYKTMAVLQAIIDKGLPISGVQIIKDNEAKKSELFLLHWKNKKIKAQRVIFNYTNIVEFNEKFYYEIVMEAEMIPFDDKYGDKVVGIVILPRIAQEEEDAKYCIVSSDWRLY